MFKSMRNLIVAGGSTVLVAGAALAFSPLALADGGTITFNGAVNTNTCDISVHGSGNATTTIPVTSAVTADLAATGDTAEPTPFTIAFTNCPTTGQTAPTGLTVDWSGANVNAAGRLNNTTGGATNVDFQLLDDTSTAINLNSDNQTATISSGSATLSYTVQYYATGAATAGNMDSSVDYTVTYN